MSDDSIQRYEQMLAEDPKSRAFAPLAEAHRKAGRLDEAIKVARAGLEVHPGYSGGLVVLGRALYEKGELDNAAEILQKAVTETPESYLGQKFLGKVLIDKGERQGAMKALEAANLLSPEDEEVARLLDEVKIKATPPKTMDYTDEEADASGEKAQIVTYEQKPTTVDGVELPPLPSREIDEPFSFSGGEVDDPADVTPAAANEPPPPVTGTQQLPAEAVAGENMTATVIEEEEVEQAMEIESLDELGPEAAAFIMEGEAAVDDSVEAASEDVALAAAKREEWATPEPERAASPKIEESALPPAAESGLLKEQPAPVTVPPHAPETLSEPAAAPAPPPVQEFVQSPEPILKSVPETLLEPVTEVEIEPVGILGEEAPQPAAPGVAPAAPGATAYGPGPGPGAEQEFSTETMADLYAQQGLIDKAVGIYRKILEQDPGNEGVKLKLGALAAEAQPEPRAVREEIQPPGEGSVVKPPPAEEKKETLRTLESLLENVERIRKP